ncbi:hypothetical protein KQI69_05320 [Eubacterium sp. MSJ-13]|uniref:hypothetical protein n=1 Tax=Eubacterium sp. MSJ-13 TaxID=2841513 RepID=UPI001C1043B1|nr:hypothetical protein [Eubacterium sp. MSJ-13]MBU5478620.1 hypothetical protein [Eubacterium sp. MSJ-13]
MKKIIVNLIVILFVICGYGSVKAQAYSVELIENGIYAKYIPKNVLETAPVMFKKNVDKVIKYYQKHKNESDYDFLQNVPLAYKNLHDAIGDLKDDDKIVICNPFEIYEPAQEDTNNEYGDDVYYFVVKKNNKKFCLFSILQEDGKLKFNYDKIWDKYTAIKNKITDDTLFYWIDRSIYAQTEEKNEMVYDGSNAGGEEMMDGSENYIEFNYSKFKQISYDEKKKVIIKYLKKTAETSGENGKKLMDKTSGSEGTGKISDKKETSKIDGLDLSDEINDYDSSENVKKDGDRGIGVKKTVAVVGMAGVIIIVAAGILYKRKHQ